MCWFTEALTSLLWCEVIASIFEFVPAIDFLLQSSECIYICKHFNIEGWGKVGEYYIIRLSEACQLSWHASFFAHLKSMAEKLVSLNTSIQARTFILPIQNRQACGHLFTELSGKKQIWTGDWKLTANCKCLGMPQPAWVPTTLINQQCLFSSRCGIRESI